MHLTIVFLLALSWTITVGSPMMAHPLPAEPELPTALADYVAQADDSYQWQERRNGTLGAGTYVELTLTSQTWRDIAWKHQLFVYRPSRVDPAAQALLLINGGQWREALAGPAADEPLPKEARIISTLSETLRAPVAVLMQVPHQPIFDDMYEDEIISFTFEKFIETGEVDWPLLLPMVKSAIRAMDAVQEFARQEWQLDVETFLVTGASKRGWTTWLTAAVDSRVTALVPMVIDVLNMAAHMELQQLSYGEPSEQLRDYTERGLQNQLDSERGATLQTIVDPFHYRGLIQQPKLIILGTNDRYWPVDALNLYWEQLEGEKHILYVPNNGHALRDYPRILGTVAALHQSLNGGPAMPKLHWSFYNGDDRPQLELSADVTPDAVHLWTATADTRDFREATWTAHPATPDDEGRVFVFELPQPQQGFAAVFAEAQFNGQPLPLYLSTNMQVIEGGDQTAAASGN